MNKTFRSGLSLHAVINDAPLPLVAQFLATLLPEHQLPAVADADAPAERDRLLDAMRNLPKDAARRLDSVAQRVIGLAGNRGADTLLRVLASRLSHDEVSNLRERLVELGRSLWTYLNREQLFEDAVSLQHALTFRDYSPIFASFDAPAGKGLSWNNDLAARLRERVVEELGLEGPVGLNHLTVEEDGSDSPSHVVIVRHGDALTSVAEHRHDGARKWHYYNPSHEITLIYAPNRGVVEVCAKSPSLRQDMAAAFAEIGLEQDLSAKPLSFKLYNLSRFRESLSLPFFEPEGFRVEAVGVVEAETRPYDPAHRLLLKVTAADDIEAVADRVLGAANIFRKAPITRVVIAVQYWPMEGRGKTRTLRIALSHPNRCDLRSERDPELRRLGYDLLEHWGILTSLRTPTPQDERALLPALLEVYDLGVPTMTEHELVERGFDVEALSGHGFIEPAGRFQGVVIDEEDDGPGLVEVQPGFGEMVEFDDAGGRPAWMPKALVTKFKINHDWVEEVVLRQLKPHLDASTSVPQIDGLNLLGELDLGGEQVPCFLARGLSGLKRLRKVDSHLRGQGPAEIGLILNAGTDAPDCLGANVVVSLPAFLNADAALPALDIVALRLAFAQGKTRARGGMVVDFVKGNDGYTGVLYVPGKDALLVAGADQVKIVERLVVASRDGSLAVRTGDLMDETGSASPSQAFPNWKGAVEHYVGSPKRGYWQLLL